MATPVKDPNEKLKTHVELLRDRALRLSASLKRKTKLTATKAKIFNDLAKIQKLKDKQLAKTASISKQDLIKALRSL